MSTQAFPTQRLQFQFLPAVPGTNAAGSAAAAAFFAKQAQDAANLAVATVGNKVDRTGDTMSGFLTLNANPTAGLHAATKQYVDAQISGTMLFQPIDADLTSLAAASTNDRFYYRVADGNWAPVTIGTNLAFVGGELLATSGGGGAGNVNSAGGGYSSSKLVGYGDTSGNVIQAITVGANLTLIGATLSATASGNVNSTGSPTTGQLAQWTDATHIQGIAVSSFGFAPLVSPVFTGDPQAPTPAVSDNDTSIATTAFVNAATAAALSAFFSTGDLKITHKLVADVGWIMWTDGTIGNLSSGSSIRSNADTQALFALYYDNYSDANCPLLTSAGAATTRAAQGTAAAAFGANCRMSLPKGGARSLALAGAGSGLTTRALGSTAGVETVTLSSGNLASHTHAMRGTSSGITPTPALASFPGGGLSNMEFAGTGSVQEIEILPTGNNTPFGIVDPTAYVNIMVRL